MRRIDPKRVHRQIGTAPELALASALGTLIGKALAERERRVALSPDTLIQGSQKRQDGQAFASHKLPRHLRR